METGMFSQASFELFWSSKNLSLLFVVELFDSTPFLGKISARFLLLLAQISCNVPSHVANLFLFRPIN